MKRRNNFPRKIVQCTEYYFLETKRILHDLGLHMVDSGYGELQIMVERANFSGMARALNAYIHIPFGNERKSAIG